MAVNFPSTRNISLSTYTAAGNGGVYGLTPSGNNAPTGSVTISGTATEGQVLTANNTLADADGLGALSYQWKRNGFNIAGATSSTYTLVSADVGNTVSVTISYTDGKGNAENSTSASTTTIVTDDTFYTLRSPQGGDLYVDFDAGVDGAGTSVSPYNTLNSTRIQSLTAGQSLWVKGTGAYPDTPTGCGAGTASNRIQIASWPGFSGTFTFSGDGARVFGGGSYIDFHSLDFQVERNGLCLYENYSFSGIADAANNVRIIDCTGTRTDDGLTDNQGIVFVTSGSEYIEIIRANFAGPVPVSSESNGQSLIWVDRTKNLKVIGCLLQGATFPFYYKHNHQDTNPANINIHIKNNIMLDCSRAVYNCVNYANFVNNAISLGAYAESESAFNFADDGGDPGGDFNTVANNTFYDTDVLFGYNTGIQNGCFQNVLRNNAFLGGARLLDNPYGTASGFDNETDTDYNAFETGSILWRNSSLYTLAGYQSAFPDREPNSVQGTMALAGGGAGLTTPSNWALTAGSIGKNAGSDSNDCGADTTKLLTVN